MRSPKFHVADVAFLVSKEERANEPILIFKMVKNRFDQPTELTEYNLPSYLAGLVKSAGGDLIVLFEREED